LASEPRNTAFSFACHRNNRVPSFPRRVPLFPDNLSLGPSPLFLDYVRTLFSPLSLTRLSQDFSPSISLLLLPLLRSRRGIRRFRLSLHVFSSFFQLSRKTDRCRCDEPLRKILPSLLRRFSPRLRSLLPNLPFIARKRPLRAPRQDAALFSG